MSKIEVDEVVNQSGDNDSGIDLTTNDQIGFKIANASKWTLNSSGNLFPAATSQGIVLGATSDTAANRLEDYEEGTFNFEMVGYHGSPSPKLTIPSHYTKVGNTVHFWSIATGLNTASYSGDVWFTGLPFTSPSPYAVGNFYSDKGVNYGGDGSNSGPFLLISGTIAYVYVHKSSANVVAGSHNVTTSVSMQLFGSYKV